MKSCLALIPEDTKRVYLAFSGGLDSSVLLHLLANNPANFTLHPWHVNHGLLDAAAEMESFCIEQAAPYDLEIRIDHLELGHIDSNVEARARQQRYGLFEAGLTENDCLLTAHHADDQAETFMLNALRGSGSAGLRGIARRRELGCGLLLRPLLDFSRQQLEDYARQHDISWFDDPSNQSNRFDRNYLRNQVVPVIRARWPNYQDALATTSRLQAETQIVLDEVAQLDFETCSRREGSSDSTLDLQDLMSLSPGRCKNLLRYWVSQAGLPAIPGARLDEVIRQFESRQDAMPEIGLSGYSIRLYDRRLFMVRDEALHNCGGVYDFQQESLIDIDSCDLHMHRADVFKVLKIEDSNQRLTIKYRNEGDQNSDRHRLKRLFQSQRVPPWERDSVAQVYLDGKLSGLLR